MRWRRAGAALLAALLCLPTASAGAATFSEPTAAAETGNPYRELMVLDALIQTIGWRLAAGNARFCDKRVPAVGLLLFDAMSIAAPRAARAGLGLDGDIAVGAVARGSPAEASGLRAGQEILRIADIDTAELPRQDAGDYVRLKGLHDQIDSLLARDGALAVTVATPGGGPATVALVPRTVCAGRFELVTGLESAWADGSRVLVGLKLLDELNGEAQLAAAIAHEYAHNLLGHRRYLDRHGRARSRVLHTEREADRLAIWLLANAGYDPGAALTLMRGWVRRHNPGLLARTHEAWDERVAMAQEEIALLAAVDRAAGGPAESYDWSGRFPLGSREARPRR